MWKQTTKVRVLFVLAIAIFSGVAFSSHTYAGVGINQQMAFEGKIVNSDGTNPTNATYNMEFKIYKGGTGTGGGTLQWTEDELVGGTGGVPLTSGTFEVNLGANTALSSVDWNSDTLWLSVQVGNTSSCTITTTFQSNCGGDGEMTPYIRLTSVPSAFNALELGGQTAASYGTLAGIQTWSAANTFSSGITANGLTFASGGIALNSGGITAAGSIAGVSTLGLTGAITGATTTNTINGLIINSGALSGITGITFTSGGLALNSGGITAAGSIAGVSTLALTGAISGATTTNTINGLIINTGALSGISTITTSGAINGITVGSTITPSAAGALTIQANGSNILGFATGTTGSAINFGNTTSNPTIGFTGSGTFGTTTGAVSLNGATTVTGTNAFTVNNALTTLGGGLTFSGTTARTIQGPGTGGLTETVTGGPLTLSTVTSGTLAVTSAGALNLTGAAASTFTTGGNSLTITSSNFNVSNVGAITAATTTNTLNGLIVNSGALSGISTISASGAITGATAGNTINGIVINGGAVSAVSTLGLSGAITGATSGNTINGLIINGGAVSGASTLGLTGAITGATSVNTINGLIINSGALTGITGITFTSGALALNSGGITAAGSIAGVSTLGLTGAITGATATNTINGIVINAGAVSSVTSLGLSGAITGATSTNTINGLIINSGALSGVTTITTSGAINGITIGSTITPSAAGALTIQANGSNILGFATGTTGSAINFGNTTSNPTVGFTGSGTFGTTTGAVSLNGATTVTGTNTLTVTNGLTNLTGGVTVNTGTGNQLSVTSGANIPTADQLAITNTGSTGVVTAGVNGLSIAYKGGAAAVESAGERIDLTPGTTSGGTWSGLRVVPNATGAVNGVTENGLKVDNLTTPGAGTENALYVGTGWDNILQAANITVAQTGAITSGGLATLNAGATITGNLTANTGTANAVSITSGTNVPTADQFTIDNTGSTGVTTAGVNGLNVHYKGGAAAVEAAGMRVDYTPGTTSGSTWSGMRIVENVAATTGVNSYGLKLEGGGSGAGNSYGIEVATGWDIGIDIQSGGIQLAATTDPAVPAANNLRIYALNIAGRIMPKWLGPSGVDTPFQASLAFNRVSWMMPAGGTTLTTFVAGIGSLFTNTGTANNPTPTSTNLMTSTRRATFSTGTTAGTVASHRQSTLQVWRGNAAGRGGFFYTIRFATDTLATGNRAFVGLSDSVAAPTNVDPTTSATIGKIGLAINASTGDWNLVSNTAGTAPTSTSLGANFTVNTTDLYELVLFSAPDGTSVGYRVTDESTGNATSGSVSTNLPATTDFLAPQFWITNNATAAAAILDFGGWYLESDN